MARTAYDAIRDGKPDVAMQTLVSAMARYPRSPDMDLIYGLACRAELGRSAPADAAVYCSAAIMRNPKNPNFYAYRAEAYYRLGQRTEACRDADAALSGGSRYALGLKSRLLWDDGAYVQARKTAETALAHDRKNVDAAFVMAAVRRGNLPSGTGDIPPVMPQMRPGPGMLHPRPVPKPSAEFSVDCARPTGDAIGIVCGTPALRRAEQTLQLRFSEAYAVAADAQFLLASQRRWVARRDACRDRSCLEQAYSERTAFLSLWSAE